MTFQGGFNTGRTVSDSCEVRAKLPEMNATSTVFGNGAALGLEIEYVGMDPIKLRNVRK